MELSEGLRQSLCIETGAQTPVTLEAESLTSAQAGVSLGSVQPLVTGHLHLGGDPCLEAQPA